MTINGLNPYKNFRFRLSFGGTRNPVAALSKISAVKRTTEVIEWSTAGSAAITKLPGRTKCEPITLEAGLTDSTAFLDWANQVYTGAGWLMRNVTITVFDMAGEPTLAFKLKKAWPSEFQALPELDANASAVAIQTLKIEYHSLIRVNP